MQSEKVKEIKELLDKCDKRDCECCCDFLDERPYECLKKLHKQALSLINELESENERLRLERDVLIGKKIAEKQKSDKALIMKIDIQEQLKDRIAELEKENATKTDTIVDLLNKQEIYEKEKLTKFAERLKENITVCYPSVIESIDKTLKEFTT